MRGLACALVLTGCGLAHERGADAGSDASSVAPFTGRCETYWRALPSCPASPAAAIGRACPVEGTMCGVACCEPGPPIACAGGLWVALDHMLDCSGVRCNPPVDCFLGGGQCAADRTCFIDQTAPDFATACVAAPRGLPAGALDAASTCHPTCTDHGSPGTVVIAPTTTFGCP